MNTYDQKSLKAQTNRGGASNKGFSLSKSQPLAPILMSWMESFNSVQVSISLFLESLIGQQKFSPVFSVLHNSDEKKGSPQEGGSRFSAISLHFTNLMFLALFIFIIGISTSCEQVAKSSFNQQVPNLSQRKRSGPRIILSKTKLAKLNPHILKGNL